jgi:tetratricopeptide (TPR) repeat protein
MGSTVTTQSASETLAPVEQEVGELRRLQGASGHAEALRRVGALLEAYPNNRDLLLIAAGSLRCLMRAPEALEMLDRLEKAHPRFSQARQERGLCFVQLKDAPRAIDALLAAVSLNPALATSWRMLEGVYRIAGDAAGAASAASQAAALKALPPQVVTATSLFFDGEVTRAERIVRAFLLEYGDHPEAMRLLARIAVARDVLDDAEILYEAMLTLAPDHQAARCEYGETLVKRHKYAKALEQARRLLALDGRNLGYRSLEASAVIGLGDYDTAIRLYRAMLADAPEPADIHLWLGHALKTVGAVPDAIDAYRAAARARPYFGEAYWSLANLKTYRFEAEEIARMRAAEASPDASVEDRTHLCFALGKALEDRGEAAGAWAWYEQGNTLRRAESGYRPEIIEANTAGQKRVCTRAFFAERIGWGDPTPDPIFVLGLPRSGSTLVEQILASHSLVEGTQELAEVQRVVQGLQGREDADDNPRYPDVLADMPAEAFRALGEAYIADTRAYRGAGRSFFIDKMPNNFRHIGLIHLMLPNARIIDVRREPMACCFSNLKQLFAQGQEFTYSVDDIARYYRTYLELMAHWDAVLPGRVLRVQHEDVVADLEGEVRRLLDHCGLPFEAACVEFHKTQRSVRTPSSEQVRQPIFREGLDQWKTFEPWLGPLRDALGDALVRYR